MIPLAVLAAATVWLRATDVDMHVAARFFDPVAHWPVGATQPWRWLKHHGTAPAWVVSLAALAVLLAGLWSRRAAQFRRDALGLTLSMALAPGLVVNGVRKKNWARQRPRDVQVLGGDREFVRVLDRAPRGSGEAFPSGHASSAFYPVALYFVLRRRDRHRAAFATLTLALSYGVLMGIARIAQGAHFVSDIVWAAAIDWFVAAALAAWLYRGGSRPA